MLHFTGKREADLVLTFVKNVVSESATSLVTPKGRDETRSNQLAIWFHLVQFDWSVLDLPPPCGSRFIGLLTVVALLFGPFNSE